MATRAKGTYGKRMILKNLTQMRFKNFSGNVDDYNPYGKRTVNIVVPNELVEVMIQDGWRVREKPPKEEGDDPVFLLKVTLGYSGDRGPDVWRISGEGSSRKKTKLSEATVGNLDHERIQQYSVDIVQYKAAIDRNPGFSAYVNSMFVEIEEDELDKEFDMLYGDIPEYDMEDDPDESGVPFN